MGVSTSSAGSLLLKRPFAVRDAKAVPAVVRRLARAALVTMGIPPTAKALSDASYVDAVDQSQLGESEAAVMLVPASVARISGPVAAIAAGPDYPSIYSAAAIAIAAKEHLMIVHAHEWETDGDGIRNSRPTPA